MLSTAVIKNAGQTSSYFMERDDYYTKEGEKFEQPSLWYGKGAAKLNLRGVVDKETFNQLLEGKLPNGIQIGATKNGDIRHRAGFDLTLSVPKSWSIAHYATKDPIFAHITDEAAKLTADLIERDCAMASRYENGKQHAELTGNLVFAFHYHRLSRELDMQDHIHMNVMNMTQRKDGEWRALKSDDPRKPIHDYSDGFLERVRARKKHYGEIFSLHIAHLAQKHNLAVRFDDKGKWELKGISKEMIDAFSTRRKQIEQNMQEKGLSSANAAEAANLATRQKKQSLTKQEIEAKLDGRLSNFPAIKMQHLQAERGAERPNSLNTDKNTIAGQAIDYAIAHLSETSDVITEEKILTCAMKQYHAKTSAQSLLAAIAEKEQQKELLALSDKGSRCYVSAIHVQREKEILSHIPKLTAGSNTVVVKDRKLQQWFNKTMYSTNAEQKKLITNTLKSNAQIHIIDTKTNRNSKITNLLAESSKYSGLEPIILCISKKEAEDRQETTKIPCMSVSQYLYQMQAQHNIAQSRGSRINLSKQMLVIENAHQLSTKQGHALMSLQSNYQNRSILAHDSKQPQSLQPGNFIKLLSNNGIQVERLDTDVKTMNQITVDRHEVSDKQTRLERISSDYINHRKGAPQSQILILGQNKTDVERLNQGVQSKLLDQGLISKNHIATTHYQPIFLTSAQRTQATQYKKGQLVSFSKTYRSLGIDKQRYYSVSALNLKENQIVLKLGNQRIIWDPSKVAGSREGVVNVFNPSALTLHQGDQLISSHTVQGVTKGKKFNVDTIKKNLVVLRDEHGKRIKIKTSDERLNHLSLGYAQTAASAYASTPDIVLADQASNTRVTNAKRYYQILSQATKKVGLYTDNIQKHDLTLAKYKGDAKPIVTYLYEKLTAKQDEQRTQDALKQIEQAEQIPVKREHYLSNYFHDGRSLKSGDKTSLRKLIYYHVAKLSDSEAVITKHRLEQEITTNNAQIAAHLDFSKLDKELNTLMKKGVLIPCKQIGTEPSFTTKRSIKVEADILQSAREMINAKQSYFEENALTQKLNDWQASHKKLNLSQQIAVKQLLLTNHKLMLINGLAGVGKTTLLEAVNSLLAEKQVKLIGLAPTNEATRQLQMRGMEAHTLDSYLIQLTNSKNEGAFDAKVKSLLVLDEASMASSHKLQKLLSLTKESNISLAFIGDVKQLPSIEQGKMFWILQKFGVDTTLVNEIVRQKDNPALLNIIKQIYRGDFKGAIERMDHMGLVIDDKQLLKENPNLTDEDRVKLRDTRLQKLVDIVSSYSPEKRDNTCVIAPANRDRNAFNQLFRESLKQKNEIDNQGSQTSVLVNSNLSPSAKSHAKNYSPGQVLLFNKPQHDCDIQQGTYLTVKEVDLKRNYLVLENEKKEKTGINAARFRGTNSKNISIYTKEDRELSKHDRIRWRYTDKSQDRINMQQAKVLEVNGNEATLLLQNNQVQKLNLTNKRDLHWDYAYASTVFSEQGNTKQFAALYMLSEQRNLASQPGFLVAMTRAIESGLLVTDDKDKLIQRIEHNTAIKTSALEALKYKSPSTNTYTAPNKRLTEPVKEQSQASSQPNPTKPAYKRYDLTAVHELLSTNAENISISLLGKPKRKSGSNLFFGSNKGSLAVSITGQYQGTWTDFDSGEKGNMLSLIMREMNVEFKQALAQAEKLVGVDLNNTTIVDNKINTQKDVTKTSDPTEYQLNQSKRAQKIAQESTPIKGTVAEQYLTQTRGIVHAEWPKDVRYHPGIYSKLNGGKYPALVVIARNKNNEVKSIQAVYLDAETGRKANVPIKKQTIGSPRGTMFCANNTGKKGTAIICEGPEDALSIAISNPNNDVFACLGKSNFKSATELDSFKNVVFALDNDGKKPEQMDSIICVAREVSDKGALVHLTQPERVKQDYNDMLKDSAYGKTAINIALEKARSIHEVLANSASAAKNISVDAAKTSNQNSAAPSVNLTHDGTQNTSSKANSAKEKCHNQRNEIQVNLEI